MSETKDKITIEDVASYLAKHKAKILEDFAKAYLAETNLKPSQVELVHKHSVTGTEINDVFYFREKKNG
jgi:hypothetical protein